MDTGTEYPYHEPIGERVERLELSPDDEIVIEALEDGRIRFTVDTARRSNNSDAWATMILTHSEARDLYYMLYRITGGSYMDGL